MNALTENAIRDFVIACTGLPQENIFWAYQANVRPIATHIAISKPGQMSKGLGEFTENFDNARPAGQEFEIKLVDDSDLSIRLDCYAADLFGTDAQAVLESVLVGGKLETKRDILAAQNLAPSRLGNVQALPVLDATEYQSRAVLDLTLLYRPTATERTGIIESYTLEDLDTGITQVIP